MAAMPGRLLARSRGCALLCAALLLSFVVELAPHLVHHLGSDLHQHTDCPFATAFERQHGTLPSGVPELLPAPGVPAAPPGVAPRLPRLTRAPSGARAPPVPAS